METGRNEMQAPPKPDDSGKSVSVPDPLTRMAEALEKLAADPEIEIEAGPPICPTCGKLDPEIVLPTQESSRGVMSQLIIDATCVHCHGSIFIVIESYSVHKSRVTAGNEVKERERAGVWK